jgi:hypothetical protein
MSAPRLTNEMLAPLKQALLARAPTLVLSAEDVETLVKGTGMGKAQVQQWAENFKLEVIQRDAQAQAVKLEAVEGAQAVKLEAKVEGAQAVKLEAVEGAQAVKVEAKVEGAQAVKVEAKVEGGAQPQPVKLEEGKQQQEVCCVIPDYQNEIKTLREALAHKTKLCDRIELQKGRLTMEVNRLTWQLDEKVEAYESLHREKLLANRKIQDLQVQLNMCQSIALLKQMQEETQRTTEILASTLAEERAAKKQRGAGSQG